MIYAPSDLVLAFFKLRMKKILILSFLFALFSCNIHDNELLFNYKCIIVKTNAEESLTKDKFHKPTICRTWLIQSVIDTTSFAELGTCGHWGQGENSYWNISNSEFYNKKIGDTLFFKYIRKDRFFKIR